ncbi:MAG: tetratricopeptide repeat protein [Polyangiaceae bacterium]
MTYVGAVKPADPNDAGSSAELTSADAANERGTALAKAGRPVEAEAAFRRAIELDPRSFKAHANLATVLRGQGRLEEAIAELARAVELEPGAARLSARLAQALLDAKRPAEARVHAERACTLEPNATHAALAVRAHAEGRTESEDTAMLRAALDRLEKTDAPARACLAAADLAREALLVDAAIRLAALAAARGGATEEGRRGALAHAVLLRESGDPKGALAALEARAEVDPDPAILRAWATQLSRAGDYPAADRVLARGVALHPDALALWVERGELARIAGAVDLAKQTFEHVLEREPGNATAKFGLARVLADAGWIDEACALLDSAARAEPLAKNLHETRLFVGLHRPADPLAVRREHERFAARFLVARETTRLGARSLDPERKLRVGYLSPDFREHAVMRFMTGILAEHDRAEFEVFCYSTAHREDERTRVVRAMELTYRAVGALSARAAAAVIRDDEIDVLVELAGHTALSRLDVLAARPAPVQISYLGYPATTGLDACDYRITDAVVDPPGESDAHCVERLLRLPNAMWCYAEPAAGEITPRPAGGPVVFASANRGSKLGDEAIAAWAEILARVQGSTMLVKGRGLGSELGRARLLRHFTARGIDPARVTIAGWTPTRAEHLASWSAVDLALDSFPYAGTTTSCEALHMGVPVVSRVGRAHVERVGASLLGAVGLGELAVDSWDAYIERAVELANDEPRRRELRKTLRDRLRASTLGDAARFTRGFEALLRDAWRSYATSREAHAASGCDGRWVRRGAELACVPRSIEARQTFVALEQGLEERDAEAAFFRASIAPGSEIVSDAGASQAHLTSLAEATRVGRVHAVVRDAAARARLEALLAVRSLPIAIHAERPSPAASASIECDAGDALALLATCAAPSDVLLRAVSASGEALATLAESAERAGVFAGFSVPSLHARGALVPARAVPSRARVGRTSLLIVGAERLASLERDGRVARDVRLEASSSDASAAGIVAAAHAAREGGYAAPELCAQVRALFDRVGHDRELCAAIEAAIDASARSSFDRLDEHLELLVEYARRGGESDAMNERLGLARALKRERAGDG